MKRKIYDCLLEWKEKDNGNCALLLDGARRVGKSYIACIFRRLSACCTAIVSNRSGLLSKSGNGKGPFRSAVIKGLSRHKRGRC
ncbi:MAG: hypothetical protein SOY73_01840, partial [Blautia sp.]|nr:hypothetical protein [Blautia sp.]